MAKVRDTVAQSNPSATTLTEIYTIPATQHFVGYVIVANRSATDTSFRVSIAPLAAADSLEQYIAYDQIISGNDSLSSEQFTLNATGKVRVYAAAATLSFSLIGYLNDN